MGIQLNTFGPAIGYQRICCYFEDKIDGSPENDLKEILTEDVVVTNETNKSQKIKVVTREKVVQAFKEKIFDNTKDLRLFSAELHYLTDKEAVEVILKIRERKSSLGEVNVEEKTQLICKDDRLKEIDMNVTMQPVISTDLMKRAFAIPLEAFNIAYDYQAICCFFDEYKKDISLTPEKALKRLLAKNIILINETNGADKIVIKTRKEVVRAFKEKLFDNTTDLQLLSSEIHYLKDQEMVSLTMKINEKKSHLGEVKVKEHTLLAWEKEETAIKIKGIYMTVTMHPI